VLKLGYKASAEQFGPTELLQFSRLAEQSGFDSVFIGDHFQPWKHHGGHAPFSLAWLGALGALTSRITIGTSVMTPTFRYHPAIVAQAFATLGVMFPDRIVLGVGTGESLNEVPSTGMTWPDFKERFARLRDLPGFQAIHPVPLSCFAMLVFNSDYLTNGQSVVWSDVAMRS
jgi:coenzyme F420-dependent glucose-6-phosphate dehydrogenase